MISDLNASDFPSRCPFCGTEHNAATEVRNHAVTPQPGDFSLCMECGEWGVFDALWKGGLRKPKFAEYQWLVADPTSRKAREGWLEATRKEKIR